MLDVIGAVMRMDVMAVLSSASSERPYSMGVANGSGMSVAGAGMANVVARGATANRCVPLLLLTRTSSVREALAPLETVSAVSPVSRMIPDRHTHIHTLRYTHTPHIHTHIHTHHIYTSHIHNTQHTHIHITHTYTSHIHNTQHTHTHNTHTCPTVSPVSRRIPCEEVERVSVRLMEGGSVGAGVVGG